MRKLLELGPRGTEVRGEGGTKVPAAWLVERAGFVRGVTAKGGAAISSKHALALTVLDGGTAADVAGPGQGRPGRREATLRGPARARTRPRRRSICEQDMALDK